MIYMLMSYTLYIIKHTILSEIQYFENTKEYVFLQSEVKQ